MYAFFGEKNLRLFDEKWNDDIRHLDSILDDLDQRRVILDRSDVDFSLETINHCNFWDAQDALQCEKKVSGDFDDVFLLSKPSFNIFQKANFYMQKSTISGDLGKKLISTGEIFLVEFLIAEFCKTVQQIDEETWWMYVANHRCSGLRIVVGRGSGIVLSRIIFGVSLDSVPDSVARTIKYLGRFGIQAPIKIISAFGNVSAVVGLSVVSLIENSEDMEKTLLKFLSTRNGIYPWGKRENSLRKILRLNYRKICVLLASCIGLETMWLVNLEMKCIDMQHSIKVMEEFSENTVAHDSSHIKLRINNNNFRQMEQLFYLLKAAKNPLWALRETAMLVEKSAIKVDRLIMEKCSSIKMNTVITKSLENKLLRLYNDVTSIHIEKISTRNSEYEKIDVNDSANKKYGAMVCIKMK
ncbi:MAG: hypothetical protein LBD81_01870 [Holosporaceae bacterium]|nr:hypothetical protein [Holosporaceae bacterium]